MKLIVELGDIRRYAQVAEHKIKFMKDRAIIELVNDSESRMRRKTMFSLFFPEFRSKLENARLQNSVVFIRDK